MANLAITYQYIADILSFESSNAKLENTLKSPFFNWDDIVVEGSKHLVLPAIYCQLRSKHLLHLLPDDLNDYLEEITSLNKDRNMAIVNQVYSLSNILNEHRIEHVFLKGAALLAGGFFNNVSERMLGDIDILVAEDQLDFAFSLLKENGYTASEQTLGHDFFEHKHLPRLKTKNNICAVELHKKLFVSHKDSELQNSNILSQKKMYNKIYLPSTTHLMRHNILNYQINDNGDLYNSISFRSAYDSIVLLKQIDFEQAVNDNKLLKNYINIIGLFFKDVQKLKPKKSLKARFYIYKLKHIRFYKAWNKLLNLNRFFRIVVGRILFFFSNKLYRKAVLNDRVRILKYFKSVLKNS